ncbi:MAG: DNA-methyltransferase [Candidatus Altimarinota bacterium]
MIIMGDCLTELKKIDNESIDLIYLDPPFFSQRTHSLKSRDNSKYFCFEDNWEDIQAYKGYVQSRLLECKRVLKETGSIFLHCDRSASHYLRIALDDVFENKNFQSEIVWAYKRWSNAKKGLLNSHQIIFFYSKSSNFKFNKKFDSYSPTTNIDQIFQKRMRDQNGKTKYKTVTDGSYDLMEEKRGVPLSDVWEIPYLNPKANERVGYPTQKPIILLERIIELVTDEGDMVLDPFCGSGTTLVAAKLLQRKYIGIDKSEDAVQLTKSRLAKPIKSASSLMEKGKEAYLNQESDILEILNAIEAEPVQRNRGIDGFLRISNQIKPIPVRIQRKEETLNTAKALLLKAREKNGFKLAVLLKTNDLVESTLFSLPEVTSDDLFIIENITKMSQLRKDLEILTS